jgi:two-component system, sensor histidine kinase
VEPTQPSRPRLLIIDDDQDTLDVLEIELRSFGYDVRQAATGEEGLAIAAEWRPGIILCDVGLPGLDGYQVARRLRDLDLEPLQLVALTGRGTDEDCDRAQEAGFDLHVLKGAARFLEQLQEAVPRLVKTKGAGG